MSLVSVIIPVYKCIPTYAEIKSFQQCLKVLGKHRVTLVCPVSLDLSFYLSMGTKLKKEIEINRFNDSYFSGIEGYNRLMLSVEFYRRFKNFEYILLYQLDAWVFKDDLEFWCKKGYDYIGAPWFKLSSHHGSVNEFLTVGNGGFSLRRIPSFLDRFYNKESLFKYKVLKAIHPKKTGIIKNLQRAVLIFLRSCGLKNNIDYYSKRFASNEDGFWSIFLQKSNIPLRIPGCEEALNFSFERFPEWLYEQNGKELPFGCHAWEKYEYETFWVNFIKENR
jgi:hypothetical protein